MVEKLAALHESWDAAKYGYLPDVASMYRNWLTARAEDGRAVFLVADHDQALAGFLIGTVEREIPIYRLKEFGFIHDVWVEPNYRHEGVARQLTMMAIEAFSGMGVEQIRLDTAAANDAARSLFDRCGFRPSVTEMLHEI